ncbi:methyltransferase domain-containing protein [Enterovibrio sp. Hal110]
MQTLSKTTNKWHESNAKLKSREIEILVKYFKDTPQFENVLEVGAGNCSQSKSLSLLVNKNLVSVDLNADRLNSGEKIDTQTLIVADAEQLDKVGFNMKFDLIFSSNVLEHLPNVKKCLDSSHAISNDDAYYVHILPNPTWRFFATVFYYPVKVRNVISRLFKHKEPQAKSSWGNNIKSSSKKVSRLSRLLPPVHGVSNNLFAEFLAFRKSSWLNTFKSSGYVVVDVLPGPISTGYGLGFDYLKPILERLGVSTEYIYVLRKEENAREV